MTSYAFLGLPHDLPGPPRTSWDLPGPQFPYKKPRQKSRKSRKSYEILVLLGPLFPALLGRDEEGETQECAPSSRICDRGGERWRRATLASRALGLFA